MRITRSISITEDQFTFCQNNRYSLSAIIQEAIDNLIIEHNKQIEAIKGEHPPFVLINHDKDQNSYSHSEQHRERLVALSDGKKPY